MYVPGERMTMPEGGMLLMTLLICSCWAVCSKYPASLPLSLSDGSYSAASVALSKLLKAGSEKI